MPYYRKFDGKFPQYHAFFLLLFQKCMSIIVSKLLLYGELPTLHDSSFLLLLGLHFVTFALFHSGPANAFMNRINNSQIRQVCQETFKGYGKGLNLVKLVLKGFALQTDVAYFLGVLVIRGSASAVFKAVYVSCIMDKPVNLKKAKNNFF